jgi:hypothetical protein
MPNGYGSGAKDLRTAETSSLLEAAAGRRQHPLEPSSLIQRIFTLITDI